MDSDFFFRNGAARTHPVRLTCQTHRPRMRRGVHWGGVGVIMPAKPHVDRVRTRAASTHPPCSPPSPCGIRWTVPLVVFPQVLRKRPVEHGHEGECRVLVRDLFLTWLLSKCRKPLQHMGDTLPKLSILVFQRSATQKRQQKQDKQQ